MIIVRLLAKLLVVFGLTEKNLMTAKFIGNQPFEVTLRWFGQEVLALRPN